MKFEILLWLFGNEKFPGLSRNGPGLLPLQRCLEPSSLAARQFGVCFHSNRPSIDPSVGSLSFLRSHSTGTLSLCISATTHLRSLRSGTDILRTFALIVSAHPYCARKLTCHVMHRARAFSSPEAALLLVSTKNRDLWLGPTTFRFWMDL